MSILSSYLRPFDGPASVSSTDRAEIRRVLAPLALAAARAGRPIPCSVRWLSRQSGVPPEKVLASLAVLERLGMAVQGPAGWSMSAETHAVCTLAAWEGAR